MARKNKEETATLTATEVPDTGLLNPKPTTPTTAPEPEIFIEEVDFNELLELERSVKQTEEQFNRIAGNIERLKKDLDVYFNHERTLNTQIDGKRKELIKRYKLNEARQWRIDINTRKVVYQG